MTDKQLNMELYRQADEIGFCEKFHGLWKEEMTVDDLIEMYKEGIEFCIDHDYPSNSFIKSNFDIHTLHRHGVFLDDRINGRIIGSGVYVFNGNCEGVVYTSDFSVVTLYTRNTTSIKIKTGVYSKIFIHKYDDSEVTVEKGLNSSSYIYNHGVR